MLYNIAKTYILNIIVANRSRDASVPETFVAKMSVVKTSVYQVKYKVYYLLFNEISLYNVTYITYYHIRLYILTSTVFVFIYAVYTWSFQLKLKSSKS